MRAGSTTRCLFPTFLETLRRLKDGIASGVIDRAPVRHLADAADRLCVGLVIAAMLHHARGDDPRRHRLALDLTAMFNPLPAIALLPLALLWFGLGAPTLVFVIIHSVLWAVALNTHSGFLSVLGNAAHGGPELRAARACASCSAFSMPAAFPSILAGLKIGWAFAWRTLIAAELVFGVSSRSGRARLVHLREPQQARHRRRCSPGCSP